MVMVPLPTKLLQNCITRFFLKMGKTLFDKIWDAHVVHSTGDGADILYIDRHYIHEVTSPQAFDGLRSRGIGVFRPLKTVATADHNVPTINQHLPIKEEQSRKQIAQLVQNCKEFGLDLYGLGHQYQGIVHIIGPELGVTQPGGTYVCGDSHTATHGAFGSIAFGIGTSEVEMVLASQSLPQVKPRQMRITVNGQLKKGVTAKDLILYIIGKLTAKGGTGYFVEYAGEAFRSLSMEGRSFATRLSRKLSKDNVANLTTHSSVQQLNTYTREENIDKIKHLFGNEVFNEKI